jgi:hypothetical protein
MPFLSPSILTRGQFAKKYLASAHEVICEQCVLPSHRKAAADGAAAGDGLSEGGSVRTEVAASTARLFWFGDVVSRRFFSSVFNRSTFGSWRGLLDGHGSF